MHPFYGPSGRLLEGKGSSTAGLVSMAAYLAFWTGAVALGLRELNARFPRKAPAAPGAPPGAVRSQQLGPSTEQPGPSAEPVDPALAILRARYARGEIDQAQFRVIRQDLEQGS